MLMILEDHDKLLCVICSNSDILYLDYYLLKVMHCANYFHTLYFVYLKLHVPNYAMATLFLYLDPLYASY